MAQPTRRQPESPRARLIVTGVVALCVALAAFLFWRSPAFRDLTDPGPEASPSTGTAMSSPAPSASPAVSPSPSATSTAAASAAPSGPPSAANLPDAAMVSGSGGALKVADEYEGPGQAAKGLCDPGRWGSPTVFQVREFGSGDSDLMVWASVLGYGTADEASAAFDVIRDAAANCDKTLSDDGLTDTHADDLSSQVPFDASTVGAQRVEVAYFQAHGTQAGSDEGRFGDTLAVLADTRLLWVTSAFTGQDNNCAPGPDDTLEQCALPAGVDQMLQRLVS